jgi:hypothetical protein
MSEFISGIVPALKNEICTLRAHLKSCRRELQNANNENVRLRKDLDAMKKPRSFVVDPGSLPKESTSNLIPSEVIAIVPK